MSTPSWKRPPERGAPYVSLYDEAPATGQTMPFVGVGSGAGGAGAGSGGAGSGRIGGPGVAARLVRRRGLGHGGGLGRRRRGRLLRRLLGRQLALALLLALTGFERLTDPLVLQPLLLDLLEVLDLGLRLVLELEVLVALVLDRGMVVSDRLLLVLQREAGPLELVHRVRRRLGGHTHEHFGLQLLARFADAAQQGDAGVAARHEPVHRDLLDLVP
jgi:hypothetical protein